MDYEVFLMSRIRERYMAHGDNERAVAEGLSSSARTISSAALIMTSVFAVFVLTGVPSIKELGLGCAVAIALDATLVRLILVPAAMKLLGDWNWWMPSWLDRVAAGPQLRGRQPSPSPPRPEAAAARRTAIGSLAPWHDRAPDAQVDRRRCDRLRGRRPPGGDGAGGGGLADRAGRASTWSGSSGSTRS